MAFIFKLNLTNGFLFVLQEKPTEAKKAKKDENGTAPEEDAGDEEADDEEIEGEDEEYGDEGGKQHANINGPHALSRLTLDAIY